MDLQTLAEWVRKIETVTNDSAVIELMTTEQPGGIGIRVRWSHQRSRLAYTRVFSAYEVQHLLDPKLALHAITHAVRVEMARTQSGALKGDHAEDRAC